MAAGSAAEAEYDVPPDAWYFAADRQERMPFAVLLEVALQPCGWLAAYIGSALTSDEDLAFRNLGGSGVLLADVTPRDRHAHDSRATMTKVSHSGGMIIQHYDFETSARRAGRSTAATPTSASSAARRWPNQVGHPRGGPVPPHARRAALARGRSTTRRGAPFPDERLADGRPGRRPSSPTAARTGSGSSRGR